MPKSYLWKAHIFMNAFIPFSNTLFGHTKSQWFGMGEPLPKQVAQQWRKWCNGAGYIKTDLDTLILKHYYNELRLPTMWLHAEDDEIATEKNVDDMIRVMPNIIAHKKLLKPSDYQLQEIGHMKYFSSKSKAIWPEALNWLEQH